MLVPRAQGGTHEAENLTLLCGGHHRAHHDGLLAITGKPPALSFDRPTPTQVVGHEPDVVTEVHAALVTINHGDVMVVG